MSDTLLNEAQTAELLAVAPGTLTDWRGQRIGPPWVKLEKRLVRYKRADVEKWLSDRTIDPGENNVDHQAGEVLALPVRAPKKDIQQVNRFGGHKTMAQRREEDRVRGLSRRGDGAVPLAENGGKAIQ